ncbi:hypothetical protein vBBceHLY2_00127 [Bacillus phage vB_BceH_LY2]|nr:hypothetical protein vBBceHLY2_00127 [Bacillus phage vB_BceH_LY2]
MSFRGILKIVVILGLCFGFIHLYSYMIVHL